MIVLYLLLSLVLVQGPQPMSGHAMVYSSVDKAVILIGSDPDMTKMRLWKWTGSKWSPISSESPTARSLPAAAYDSDRGELIIQGGATKVGSEYVPQSSTLIWNGNTWRSVQGGPSARDHHSMVYDSSRHRIVLFGGGNADRSGRSDFYGDTWEWDGERWVQMKTQGPPPRVHFAMAFDPESRRTLVAGGYGPGGQADNRTWEWDGKAWRVAAQGGPLPSSSPKMVFSSEAGGCVLFGGDRPAQQGKNLPQ